MRVPPRITRVALLSDTHGSVDPRIAERVADCDLAVHAGDIGNASVFADLQPRSGRVIAVRGNNDEPPKWPSSDAALLSQIPDLIELELCGGVLVVLHGDRVRASVRHEKLRRRFPAARAVLYGHSHRLVIDTDASPWILNPGAAGRARTRGGPSCLILEVSPTAWSIEPVRFPAA